MLHCKDIGISYITNIPIHFKRFARDVKKVTMFLYILETKSNFTLFLKIVFSGIGV